MTAKTSSLASISARNISPPPLLLGAPARGEALGELIMLAISKSGECDGRGASGTVRDATRLPAKQHATVALAAAWLSCATP